MITEVSIQTIEAYPIKLASFSLRRPNLREPYYIRTIVGLDADEIVPKFYGTSTDGNTKFHSFVPKERELVMRIILNPDFQNNQSYSSVRDDLYRIISRARGGDINLYFHEGVAVKSYLTGRITKFEVPHFSKTPEIQVTITCKDPFFKGLVPVTLEADNFFDTDISIYDAESTAPHGITFTVTFLNGISTDFYIIDGDQKWEFRIQYDAGRPIEADDVLTICSKPESKCVTLDKYGLGTTFDNMLDLVTPTSIWPVVFPGLNEFEIPDWNDFVMTAEYSTTYWGV